MKKLFTRIILLVLSMSLIFSFGISVSACTKNEEQALTDNIPNDKYGNYYHVFVSAFNDSNGDGYGDIGGITAKLDYLKDLGYTGIYLSPINKSNTYHGYDVEDYYDINSYYGTMADFDTLISSAHSKGIKVMLDMVFNHTSNQHQWFKDYCGYWSNPSTTNPDQIAHKDYYCKTTTQYSYNKIGTSSYYYECGFGGEMPDLNLDSAAVKTEISNIMKFWLTDKGVDGFRYDACTSFYGYANKDEQDVVFLKWLVDEARSIKSDVYQVGEVLETDEAFLLDYYNSGIDSLFFFPSSNLNTNVGLPYITSPAKTEPGSDYTALLLNAYNNFSLDGKINAPILDNHDAKARVNNTCATEVRTKMTQGLLAMMNGTTFTYYGSEIGMASLKTSKDTSVASSTGLYYDQGIRLPIQWEAEEFYTGQVIKWNDKSSKNHIIGNGKDISSAYEYGSVSTQLADENSILNYYKKSLQIRNAFPSIARGVTTKVEGTYSDYVSVINKTYNGESITILINLNSSEEETVVLERKTSGYSKGIATSLLIDTSKKASLKKSGGNDTITLPAFSIVILK